MDSRIADSHTVNSRSILHRNPDESEIGTGQPLLRNGHRLQQTSPLNPAYSVLWNGRTCHRLLAGPLKFPTGGKERNMWVFDGEQWTQDDGSEHSTAKPEMPRQWVDDLVPELQVIEIVQVPKQMPYVPPLPLP